MAAAWLALATPARATVVYSQPGALHVSLDDQSSHTIEVRESQTNTVGRPFVVGLAALPAVREMEILAAGRLPGTPATRLLYFALLAGLIAWESLVQEDGDENESQAVFVVSDLEGHPMTALEGNDFCRPAVRYTDHYDGRATAVACSVIPGTLPGWDDGPTGPVGRLIIDGSRNRDRIIIKQYTKRALQYRYVDGEDGNDLLVGSHYDDRMLGGLGADTLDGRDGSDWLQIDGDDAADIADCGDPAPGEPDEAEDLVDPGWEDFDSLVNCEDIAYPELPASLR